MLLTKWFRLTIPGTPDAGCLFIALIVYIRKSLEGALTTGVYINRAPDLCNADAEEESSVRQRGVICEIYRRASDFEVLLAVKFVGVTP